MSKRAVSASNAKALKVVNRLANEFYALGQHRCLLKVLGDIRPDLLRRHLAACDNDPDGAGYALLFRRPDPDGTVFGSYLLGDMKGALAELELQKRFADADQELSRLKLATSQERIAYLMQSVRSGTIDS